MEKKFADIDKKAEIYKEQITKKPPSMRVSRDTGKTFDKISTRYNYQTMGGIPSYAEKERELKMKKMSQQDWTKQAVNITNQIVKERRNTPSRIRQIKNRHEGSKEDLESMLFHQTQHRAPSKQRGGHTTPTVPMLEMASIDIKRAGETFQSKVEDLHPRGNKVNKGPNPYSKRIIIGIKDPNDRNPSYMGLIDENQASYEG